MADTLNDVILLGAVYQDIYSATSIIIGTPLVVQNKSATNLIYLQISATAPPASDIDGKILYPGKELFVSGATTGLWAKGLGRLHVEVDA
jgi:hypothetical protein